MNSIELPSEILQGLLTSCAQLIDTLNRMLESSCPPQAPALPACAEPDSTPAIVSVPMEASITKSAEPAPELSEKEVLTLLSAKAKEENGKFRSKVKDLVQKYANGGTFTQIPQASYPDLLADLEAI